VRFYGILLNINYCHFSQKRLAYLSWY